MRGYSIDNTENLDTCNFIQLENEKNGSDGFDEKQIGCVHAMICIIYF